MWYEPVIYALNPHFQHHHATENTRKSHLLLWYMITSMHGFEYQSFGLITFDPHQSSKSSAPQDLWESAWRLDPAFSRGPKSNAARSKDFYGGLLRCCPGGFLSRLLRSKRTFFLFCPMCFAADVWSLFIFVRTWGFNQTMLWLPTWSMTPCSSPYLPVPAHDLFRNLTKQITINYPSRCPCECFSCQCDHILKGLCMRWAWQCCGGCTWGLVMSQHFATESNHFDFALLV